MPLQRKAASNAPRFRAPPVAGEAGSSNAPHLRAPPVAGEASAPTAPHLPAPPVAGEAGSSNAPRFRAPPVAGEAGSSNAPHRPARSLVAEGSDLPAFELIVATRPRKRNAQLICLGLQHASGNAGLASAHRRHAALEDAGLLRRDMRERRPE